MIIEKTSSILVLLLIMLIPGCSLFDSKSSNYKISPDYKKRIIHEQHLEDDFYNIISILDANTLNQTSILEIISDSDDIAYYWNNNNKITLAYSKNDSLILQEEFVKLGNQKIEIEYLPCHKIKHQLRKTGANRTYPLFQINSHSDYQNFNYQILHVSTGEMTTVPRIPNTKKQFGNQTLKDAGTFRLIGYSENEIIMSDEFDLLPGYEYILAIYSK